MTLLRPALQALRVTCIYFLADKSKVQMQHRVGGSPTHQLSLGS